MAALPSLLILFFLAVACSANEGNVLLTGDVLATDGQLSYAGNTFVMQGDCNLVLYNGGSGFQSDTHGAGDNCTLSLTDHGQLVITTTSSSPPSVVWLSPEGKRGKYAAVLRPDGQVAVYGPDVWSTPDFNFRPEAASGRPWEAELAAIPSVRNVLFSSQVLYANAELASRDYTFVMTDDCELTLNKAGTGVVWRSGTAGIGRRHCFVRLDHRGQLAVVGDHDYKALWTSKKVAGEGAYVLILQINGQAVVYGPIVWSTNELLN